MKETTISKTYELPNGLKARIVISRKGQEPANEGDRVVVVARVHLPKSPGIERTTVLQNLLHEDIRFKGRVVLFDEALGHDWGEKVCQETFTPYRSREYTADKWSAAFRLALEDAERELSFLQDAIARRMQALIDAEKD